MSRPVRVSALGPAPIPADPSCSLSGEVRRQEARLSEWIYKVLPECPDLIVLHEACDRPSGLTREVQTEYYALRGETILDRMREICRREGVNIAYSAALGQPDGTYRNCTTFLGRNGETRGIYCKNHLVIEERTEGNVLYGKDAPVIPMDFGTVAGVICFDLNFDELREKYVRSRPELLVFSSMYHGGFVQQNWAYTCRSWFVGACAGLPCGVIDPTGKLVAESTNYYPYVTHTINLDYAVAHLDHKWEALDALRRTYKTGVRVSDPGLLGAVLLTSECEVPVSEMVREAGVELLDDYFARSLADRHIPEHIG